MLLTGATWPGRDDAAKEIVARQDKVDINWEIFEAAADLMIPKIKAAMPNPPYDFVAQYDPLYYTWMEHDWAELLSTAEMPSLKDIPDEYLYKNAEGQVVNVPISLSAVFFGYRKDIAPFPIKTMEDLLDPRLKGKLCLRDASQEVHQMVHYALAFGGTLTDLEPGWEFLERLMKIGNVARFAKADADFIDSLSTGESVVGISNLANWGKVAANVPTEFLILDKKEAPGFQAGLVQEGFMILKTSPNKTEAKEFINFFVNPENNTIFNEYLGTAPSNTNAQATELAQKIQFKTDEDRDKFTILYDWEFLNDQIEPSIARFEKEILPLAEKEVLPLAK